MFSSSLIGMNATNCPQDWGCDGVQQKSDDDVSFSLSVRVKYSIVDHLQLSLERAVHACVPVPIFGCLSAFLGRKHKRRGDDRAFLFVFIPVRDN